jgi:SAM-dependent methyltransferase
MTRAEEIENELLFWKTALGQDRDDLKQRADPNRWIEACPDIVKDIIDRHMAKPEAPLVLDVGCGPLSQIAYVQAKGAVLLGLDELARSYKTLLGDYGITPNCAMLPVNLDLDRDTDIFVQSAALVWMRNALDHTSSPDQAFKNLVKMVAPGGDLVVSGIVREGKHQNYVGMHQTDLFISDGRLLCQYQRGPAFVIDASDLEAVSISQTGDWPGQWLTAHYRRPSA